MIWRIFVYEKRSNSSNYFTSLLNILTCGLFCWIYKTIISIKDFTGKVDINPSIEVLLVFLLAGFILSIGIMAR